MRTSARLSRTFLAPELRAISARLEAADKIAEARHQEMMARFATMEQRFMFVDQRLDISEQRLSGKLDQILKTFEIDKRLGRLEEMRDKPAS